MCEFFSFVTEPNGHGGERYYNDWEYRKEHLEDDDLDSHSSICRRFEVQEDKCNKYEYNPLTRKFKIDKINSEVDDSLQAEDWVRNLDFKKIVEPLIIKDIVSPFSLEKRIPTDEDILLLKQWASTWASVWSSVGDSTWEYLWSSQWDSVRDSAWDSVRDSVREYLWSSLWDSVRPSVEASAGAYTSSFIRAEYEHDFSAAVKLWERGLVPSFDGTTWRLHSGKNADVVFEISESELQNV